MKITTTLLLVIALTFATLYFTVSTLVKYVSNKTRLAVLRVRPSGRFSYNKFMRNK